MDRPCYAKHLYPERLQTKVTRCGFTQIGAFQSASSIFGRSRLPSLYMYSALSVLDPPRHVESFPYWSSSALSGCRLKQAFNSRSGAEVNLPPVSHDWHPLSYHPSKSSPVSQLLLTYISGLSPPGQASAGNT
jgi:hypothetical protein